MRVLYCGDTTLNTAAAYLGGLVTHWGWELQYVESAQILDDSLIAQWTSPQLNFDIFVFSDFPADHASGAVQQRILDRVNDGAGLIMIGGWESYHGLGGNWDGTPIGEALPVEISSNDDRVNSDQPVFVDAIQPAHPILSDLPWTERPPIIGGFNRFTAKSKTDVLLEAVTHQATKNAAGFELREERRDPLLVAGSLGSGRTLALATDVAPHWVGPLVDWGDDRVLARADGAESVEVGNLYAQVLYQMLSWAGSR
jgi:hypothetical protein